MGHPKDPTFKLVWWDGGMETHRNATPNQVFIPVQVQILVPPPKKSDWAIPTTMASVLAAWPVNHSRHLFHPSHAQNNDSF